MESRYSPKHLGSHYAAASDLHQPQRIVALCGRTVSDDDIVEPGEASKHEMCGPCVAVRVDQKLTKPEDGTAPRATLADAKTRRRPDQADALAFAVGQLWKKP